MMRTWAGWYAAALAAHYAHGAARPLLVVLDCKGGPDARVKAARTRTPFARRRRGPCRDLARRGHRQLVGPAAR